ncbi:MAG: DUF421 domain-containing protein [Firmicutes bacterium]|nr:DUF421 domain-containing protein [Bacillota bacterium]
MIIVLIRTIIIYLLVLFVIRMMGKSELSAMEPFQLVVTLMIADLAVVPIESAETSLFNGIAALIALLFVQVLVSYITLKSEKMRSFICGTPSIVIRDGSVDSQELRSLRISTKELEEQLRVGGYSRVQDIHLAIVETNGALSVILKEDQNPLTKSDLVRSESLNHLNKLIYKGESF